MTLPCLVAARRFDAAAHAPFFIGDERVGWIRKTDVPLLARWHETFVIGDDAVRLNPSLDDIDKRSAALATVIAALHAEGNIPGWRDETYAIRNHFDAAPLAFIERAASRFFGTITYAVHVNGIVKYRDSAPRLWIARRSHTKSTDPGMLDNVVAGGIGWGYGLMPTLAKECWEEAGMPEELAMTATPGGTFHVLQSAPEGTQAEQIFVYDIALPPDFTPRNQDGEVAEHREASIDEVARWIEEGEMTVDASLATLDCLLRHRWIDEDACQGIEALYAPPPV
ncbi:NUDIX hydrolase family protein [Caballeronia sp. BCC1704]|uniref:NUDIX hydrolase n=1 Tax=Caballeronia sp. BCC1704 TaxID=2676300 RepID=UPI00158B2408|nr:NUDIX hydrolase family protein [Caballeronia sp. BCC1704]